MSDWSSVLGAGIAASAATQNALYSAYASNQHNAQQNDFNWEMAIWNRYWDNVNNQLQRDFQSSEADKIRNWQTDEWSRQFGKENAYNSPAAQVERLKAAGINPAAVFGNVGTASGASPSTPIASTPSAPSMVNSPGQFTPNWQNPWQNFGMVAKALSDLADAGLKGLDTSFFQQTFASRVALEENKSNLAFLQASLLERFGDRLHQEKINNLIADTNRMSQEAINLAYSGEVDRANALWADDVARLKKKYWEFLAGIQEKTFNWFDDTTQAQINQANSSVAKNYGEAAQARAAAKRLGQQYNIDRPTELKADAQAAIYETNEGVSSLLNNFANQLLADNTKSEAEISEAYTKLEEALHNRKWTDYRMCIQELSRATGLATDVVQNLVPLGKFRALMKLASSAERNSNTKQDKLQFEKDKANSIEREDVVEVKSKNGKTQRWTQRYHKRR